jgi:hypothetical protein
MTRKALAGRSDAAFFCTSNTELTSSITASCDAKVAQERHTGKKKPRGKKRLFVDGIVNGERLLVAQRPKEREKGVEIRIRVALATAGVLCWKHKVDYRAPFGQGLGRGVADLICVVPPFGRFLAIEVKRPGARGRTTEDQDRWLAVVRRFGGVSGIATSVEEALGLVEEAKRLPASFWTQ